MAMPKNVQTTTQLHLFHMPARKCSKSFMLGFNSTWSENFQMFKQRNYRSNCQHLMAHIKSKGIPEKKSTSASLNMLKPLTVWVTTNFGQLFKRWEYPDYLTSLLKNLYSGQEATVKTRHEIANWFKIGKGVHQGCILTLCLLKLYVENIIWNAGMNEAQDGIRIARININNLRYADGTTLMAEGKEELKSLLMKMKEESEKADLELNIQKTKIMASRPIPHGKNRWGKIEKVTDFILGGSKITVDGDCSHKVKRCLLLGRKSMTNLDNVLKSRDITLLTKVHIRKAMVFPIFMYRCASWTIKKAECWTIDACELWCWRLLRAPWTTRSE